MGVGGRRIGGSTFSSSRSGFDTFSGRREGQEETLIDSMPKTEHDSRDASHKKTHTCDTNCQLVEDFEDLNPRS